LDTPVPSFGLSRYFHGELPRLNSSANAEFNWAGGAGRSSQIGQIYPCLSRKYAKDFLEIRWMRLQVQLYLAVLISLPLSKIKNSSNRELDASKIRRDIQKGLFFLRP